MISIRYVAFAPFSARQTSEKTDYKMDMYENQMIALQSMESCRQELNELISSYEGWEKYHEQDGFKAYSKPSSTGMSIIKTEGMMNFQAEQIVSYLLDYKRRPEWNEVVCRIEELAHFSEEFLLLTHEIKIGWPISNRDFVYAIKVEREENRVFVLFKSCDGVLPEKRGVVRADMINCSFVLQPIENQTKVISVFYGNPNGSLPGFVKNKIAKMQSGVLKRLTDILSK